MESIPVILAFLINWGWLQIDLYMHININPVIFSLGPLALHWYGLMYVVAIVVGLWLIRGYTARKGISQDQIYRIFLCFVLAVLRAAPVSLPIPRPAPLPQYR